MCIQKQNVSATVCTEMLDNEEARRADSPDGGDGLTS